MEHVVEDRGEARYTQFPDLRSNYLDPNGKFDEADIALSSLASIDNVTEILTHAWAYLLCCYTGVDRPIFRVSNRALQYDLITRLGWEVTVAEIDQGRDTRTGVVSDEAEDTSGLALYVRHDRHQEIYLLHSSGFIESRHLGQISRQLEEIIRAVIQGTLEDICWLDQPAVQLSIVNENPKAETGSPPVHLLHQLLNARPTNADEAIVFLPPHGDKVSVSYLQLLHRSEAFSQKILSSLGHVHQHGDDRQPIIPILLPQGPDLYISILGILQAGAAFCPLDLDVPDDRLRFIIGDVHAALIVTDQSNLSRCRLPNGPTILLADEILQEDKSKISSISSKLVQPRPSDLAYVMYTSGSTGTPKGVCISHYAATQSILAHQRLIPDFSIFLQFAAPAFDVFVFEMFFPLFRGCTLFACHRNALLGDLAGVIRCNNVDAAELTPTVVGGLLKSRKNVPGLKVLLTIGEMLTRPIVEEFGGNESKPNILHAMYGPTEAAIHCTLVQNVRADMKPTIIGQPLGTVSACVISAALEAGSYELAPNILPVGHVGELAVGGHQNAQGYLNDSRKTDLAFKAHPALGRLYLTGDKARLLPDGQLEILGRMKTGQVKLRGQRVELGEVSEAVLRTPRVHAVSCDVIDSIMIAFCLVDDDSPTEESVLETSRRWLPSFMVPGDVVLLKSFPRMVSGKVDSKALERLYAARKSSGACENPASSIESALDSWNTMELVVRDTLSRLSGVPVENISPTSTIYQLGIDSLAAVHVAAELRYLAQDLTIGDVLEYPSIKKLASHIKIAKSKPMTSRKIFDFPSFDLNHRSPAVSRYDLTESDIESVRPCTPVQAGMIAQFLHSTGSMYLNHFVMEMDPNTDLHALKLAWSSAQDEFEMLRTGFVETNDDRLPFAMVTYKVGTQLLPWLHDNHQGSNCMDRQRSRGRMGSGLVETLKFPPWRLAILEDDSRTLIEFSALHALYDAYALQIILEHVTARYHGRQTPTQRSLEPLMSNILTAISTGSEAEDRFWVEYLGEVGLVRFPNLTPNRTRSTATTVMSKSCSWSRSRLETSCGQCGVSVQAAGQAAWARILSAYTGEKFVTFGLVLSGRLIDPGAENVVFPCINTLPLHCQLKDSNLDLMRKILNDARQLLRYQVTPLSKIQHLTGHARRALFDTLFVLQKSGEKSRDLPRPWKIIDEVATVDCAISIELEPIAGDELQLRIIFQEDLIPPAQAKLLLDQFDAALVDTVSRPNAACNDLTGLEKSLLSIKPPIVPVLPSKISFLHEFVESQARLTPDKVALEWVIRIIGNLVERRSWTYAELDREGNRIGHFLKCNGSSSGDMIGICFDKCSEASFAILGILKAGCSYVAIDPGAPQRRKGFIIDDSGLLMVLCMTKQAADFGSAAPAKILCLDDADTITALRAMPTSIVELRPMIRPQDTCYCLYTSGTTGTPKGCEITHENAVQAMLAFQGLFTGRWNSESRWLQFASFHFDVSVLEQYWSWSVGICVTSAPRDLIFEDIARAIRVLGITHIDLTPSLAKLVSPDEVPSLHDGVFITGGEKLSEEVIEAWGAVRCIFNSYGPTEATIGVTTNSRLSLDSKPANIGRQFDNVGTYVFHLGTTIPVLRGTAGELCISGKLVGKGYLNQSKLTAERFPTLEETDERIYRTGDLVRILCDDSFEYLGRTDDQIKLRGQRMEVEEINAIIKRDVPGVDEVVTLLLHHPSQSKDQITTFLVIRSSASKRHQSSPPILDYRGISTLPKVREACLLNLPTYMIPTYLVPINAIPLSANNKADTRQIKDFFATVTIENLRELSSNGTTEGTISTNERKIIKVLVSMTSITEDDITRHSNIFQLGLDSITVIKFSRILRERGFAKAKTSIVMSNNTVGSLAKALEGDGNQSTQARRARLAARQRIAAFAQKHSSTVCKVLQLHFDEVEAIAPCTPLQEGMLSKSLSSDMPFYLSVFSYNVPIDLDLPRFKKSWYRVIERCQILRTRFVSTSDGFAQVVLKDIPLPWVSIERSMALDHRPEEVKQWYGQNRRSLSLPFQLLYGRSSEGACLWLCHHHALFDFWSHRRILSLVTEEYRYMANHSSIDYGPPWFDVLAAGPLCEVDGEREFWAQVLEGSSDQSLPALVSSCSEATLIISGERLEQIRRDLASTHQAVIQACWINVLQRYLGESIILGIVVSGRTLEIEGAEKTVGPMFNSIPFYIQTKSSTTWATVVKTCQNFNTAALPYQHTALRKITKWCGKKKGQPLFDILFSYISEPQPEVASEVAIALFQLRDGGEVQADVRQPACNLGIQTANEFQYPLALEASRSSEGDITFTVVAHDIAIEGFKPAKLLEELAEALETLIRDPQGPFSDCSNGGDLIDGRGLSRDISDNSLARESEANFQWSPAASELRREIARLAGVDPNKISERTSILEIGLDSIDAIKLSSRMTQKGIHIKFGTVLRHLTIANILEHVDSDKGVNVTDHATHGLEWYEGRIREYLLRQGYDLTTIEEILPATPLQESMVAEMRSSNYKRYLNHDILRLDAAVSGVRLKSAWTSVVSASPILRSSFIEVDDPSIPITYALLVNRPNELNWQSTTLSDDIDVEHHWNHLMSQSSQEIAEEPGKSPLAFLLLSHRGVSYLLLSISHALYDGHSLAMIHQDVQRAYAEDFSVRPSHRPILENIIRSNGDDAADFWHHRISSAHPCVFPTQGGRNPLQVHRHEIQSTLELKKVWNFCRSQESTLQALGQTCWAIVLAHQLRKLDVVFGVVISGRDTEDAYEVAFPVMNTIAVRAILHGSRREMVRFMQEENTSMLQYQHYPLRKIQALAKTGGQRVFDTLFVHQKRPTRQDKNMKPLYRSAAVASETEYPVCIEMDVVEGGLTWRIACHSSVLDENQSKQLLEEVDSVLLNMITLPDAPTIDFGETDSLCGLPPVILIDESRTLTNHEMVRSREATKVIEWSEMEQNIRRILSEVSKTPETDITRDQTIFHLGLDSISVIKVASLLRKNSINLSVSEILQAGTISDMAAIAHGRQTSDGYPLVVETEAVLARAMNGFDESILTKDAGIDLSSIQDILPVSAGQEYFLSRWQTSRGVLFCSEFTYKANKSLDGVALEKAWSTTLMELSILRTTFVASRAQKGSLFQVILKHSSRLIVWTDHGKSANNVTDLRRPPVALYAQQTALGTLLKLKIHHALYDAVSLPLIFKHLQDLYNQPEQRTVAEKPDMKLFVASTITSSPRTSRQTFWTQYLSDLANSSIRRDSNRCDGRSRTEVYRSCFLPAHTVASLNTHARSNGCTIQALFIAAYAKVYSRIDCMNSDTQISLGPSQHSRTDSVVLGIYLANRSLSIPALASAPIPSLNLVPLRINHVARSLNELATDIQRDLQLIGSPQNSCVSLVEIAEWTKIEIDTFVNFIKLPEAEPESSRTTSTHFASSKNDNAAPVEFHPVRDERWGSTREEVTTHKTVDDLRPVRATDGDIFGEAIDIEATITEVGNLDMGLFCDTDRFTDVDGARSIMEAVKAELIAYVEIGSI